MAKLTFFREVFVQGFVVSLSVGGLGLGQAPSERPRGEEEEDCRSVSSDGNGGGDPVGSLKNGGTGVIVGAVGTATWIYLKGLKRWSGHMAVT